MQEPETKQEKTQKQPTARSKKMLLIYALAFASVVVVLIGVSYAMQLKENRELAGSLQEQETVAQGAVENIKKLQAEYEKLSSENAELKTLAEEKTIETNRIKDELDDYKLVVKDAENAAKVASEQLLESEKKSAAYSNMTELMRLNISGDFEGARNIIAIMEQKKERALLDTMSRLAYDQIKTELASPPNVTE